MSAVSPTHCSGCTDPHSEGTHQEDTVEHPAGLTLDPLTHTYRIGQEVLPSVTQILSSCRIVSYDEIDPDVLERKAALGTSVHEWTARYDRRDVAEAALWESVIGTDAEPYCLAWTEFRDQSGFTPELVEHMFSHTRHGMRYAGTIDRAGEIGGVRAVIEIKTSAAPCRWWGLQLMGYALALQRPARPAPRRIAVQLRADGTYAVHEYAEGTDQGVFGAALALATWKRANATPHHVEFTGGGEYDYVFRNASLQFQRG